MPEPKFPGARIEAFKPVDVSKYGKKEIEKSKSHEIKASHIKIALDKANEERFPNAGSYGEQRTVYIGGDVENVETGVKEHYDVSHVELPNGSIKERMVKSVFTYPDGRSETEVLEREFDAQGRVVKETDTVDGKVMEERTFKYDGNLVSEFTDKRFNDKGEAIWGNQKTIEEKNIKNTYIELGREPSVHYEERRSSTHDARPWSPLSMKRSTLENSSGRMID